MYYYEVYVAEQRYQKADPLTYSSSEELLPREVVRVPYGTKEINGFVHRSVPKPSFNTKPVTERSHYILPAVAVKLHTWLQDFYPYGSGSITNLFLPSDKLKPLPDASKPAATAPADLPPLTTPQQHVIDTIQASSSDAFVLHGETGSGKTRLYIELALSTIQDGRSVMVLTPEISLTPQLIKSFEQSFAGRVIMLHSGVTKAKRRTDWQRIATTAEPLVVIGTRSALFAPLRDIGLIVVDEMHEPAYKQDSAPRYYALRVAAAAARLHQARIVYGSATPSITDYYLAGQKQTPILRLTEKAKAAAPVKKTLIDLRDTAKFGRDRYLSDALLAGIENRLATGEQSLLFLNRRGTARQVLCKACGWQALCPHCDLPLTFHADAHQLRCHTCGFAGPPPFSCPECGQSDISYRSLGTKALVDALQRFFPEARIARFDTDNTAAESLERNFEAVANGKFDILIGTQMLGKGLDLPLLSLVGIVNADTSLTMPDFSSAERNYQLLHQAIGRVGRGHRRGEIILQSFRPDDPLLGAALDQQWHVLYDQEIKERQSFLFPPFVFLLSIRAGRSTPERAEAYLHKLRQQIAALRLPVKIEEPTPCFYERAHGKYHWQIVIKSKSRQHLVDIMKQLPPGDYTCDIDPLNLL